MACEPDLKNFAEMGTTQPLTPDEISEGFVTCGPNRPTVPRLNWLFGWLTCHMKRIEGLQTRLLRRPAPDGNIIDVRHNGTWPDEVIREPKLERDGDIVILTFYRPDGTEESVAIESPENLIILNNPVIYVRQATGQPNPPIEEQADLTVANAFDSIVAVKNFLQNALVVGSITIDVRGTFSNQGDVGSGAMKNAVNIAFRGDPDDVSGFRLVADKSSGNNPRNGMSVGSGGSVSVRDCTLVSPNVGELLAGRFAGIQVSNGILTLRGRIRFEGNCDANAPGVNAGIFGAFAQTPNGTLRIETADVQFALSPGHAFHAVVSAETGSNIRIGHSITFEFLSDVNATAMWRVRGGGRHSGLLAPNPAPVLIPGPGQITGGNVWIMENLCVNEFGGWDALNWTGWPMSPINNSIAPYAVVNGTMGLDL